MKNKIIDVIDWDELSRINQQGADLNDRLRAYEAKHGLPEHSAVLPASPELTQIAEEWQQNKEAERRLLAKVFP